MSDLNKAYRGAFNYFEKKNIYSEETFDVYKAPDGKIQFNSELNTRVANGEFLKIKVLYRFSKNFAPLHVVIDKALGSQHIQEIFATDSKKQTVTYMFNSEGKTEEREVSVPPKFHIATPSACTSFLYFLSKKFDSNGSNFYNILTSNNMWEFETEPTQSRIVVESPRSAPVNIKLGENTLQANQYNMFTEDDDKKIKPTVFYISKHMSIPYRINGPQNIKVEVKYLNHLEKETNLALM